MKLERLNHIPVLLALCFHTRADAQCEPGRANEIVERGAGTMQSDWRAFPNFAFVERDLEVSKGVTTIKTHRVFMIDGTDYYMAIAENDKPYTVEQLAEERKKLRNEVDHRNRETAKERQRRSERYWKERNQTGILLEQFVKAFDFRVVGEEVLNGHSACVLDAKPRLDYRPPNREAKILTGMEGRLWIEKHDYHWLKAEADVLKPVSILGIAVRVLPGTHMELEMAPVTQSLWLVSHFVVTVKASILLMKTEQAMVTSWSGYEPSAAALDSELAGRLESSRR